jgi:hypothetical protein
MLWIDRTVKLTAPLEVFCGEGVTRAVEPPLVFAKLTAYVPLLVGLPFASTTWTVATEVDAPSATMGLGAKEHVRPAAKPAVNTSVAVVVADGMFVSVKVTVQPLVAAVLEKVKVAWPAVVVAVDDVTVVPDAGVRAAGQPLPEVLLAE